MKKQMYVVTGINLSQPKGNDLPYIYTSNHKKALKALQYCKEQHPAFSWTLTTRMIG